MGNTHPHETDRFLRRVYKDIHYIKDKAEGSEYQGTCEKNKKHGMAIEKYTSDEGMAIYVGYFKKGVKCGFGQINFFDTQVYTGFWQENTMSGSGKIKYSQDQPETYDGQMQNNSMCGYGSFYYLDKSHYEGFWTNNQMHGVGFYISEQDNWRYVGEFKGDTMDGYGIYERELFKKLSSEKKKRKFLYIYEGMFEGDKKDRFGIEIFRFSDGSEVTGYRYPEKVERHKIFGSMGGNDYDRAGGEPIDSFIEIEKILYEEDLPERAAERKRLNRESNARSMFSHKLLSKKTTENSASNLFGKRIDTMIKHSNHTSIRPSLVKGAETPDKKYVRAKRVTAGADSLASGFRAGSVFHPASGVGIEGRASAQMFIKKALLAVHQESSDAYKEFYSRADTGNQIVCQTKYISVLPTPPALLRKKKKGEGNTLILEKEECKAVEALEKIKMIRETIEKRKADINLDPFFVWNSNTFQIVAILKKANGRALYAVKDKKDAQIILKTYLCNSFDEFHFNAFEYAVMRMLDFSDFVPKLVEQTEKSYFLASYDVYNRHSEITDLPKDGFLNSKVCIAMEKLEPHYFLNELFRNHGFSSKDVVIISEKILDAFSFFEQNNVYHSQIYPHHIFCQEFDDIQTCRVKIVDFSEALVIKSDKVYSRYQCFLRDEFKEKLQGLNDIVIDGRANKKLQELLGQFIHPFGEYSSRTKKYLYYPIKEYLEKGHMDHLKAYNIASAQIYSLGILLLRIFASKSPNPDIEDDFRILSEAKISEKEKSQEKALEKILDKICKPIIEIDDMLGGFLEIIKNMIKLKPDVTVLSAHKAFTTARKGLLRPLKADREMPRASGYWRCGSNITDMFDAKDNRPSKIFKRLQSPANRYSHANDDRESVKLPLGDDFGKRSVGGKKSIGGLMSSPVFSRGDEGNKNKIDEEEEEYDIDRGKKGIASKFKNAMNSAKKGDEDDDIEDDDSDDSDSSGGDVDGEEDDDDDDEEEEDEDEPEDKDISLQSEQSVEQESSKTFNSTKKDTAKENGFRANEHI